MVTGAFGALGHAVTKAALDAGATVAAVDRANCSGELSATANLQRWGGIDLSVPAAAEAVFKAIAASMGGINGLVNVAGGFRWETVADGSIDTWDFMYTINLRTAVVASQSALPYIRDTGVMPPRGRLISVGASAGTHAGPGMGAYSASKAGISRFTEALAAELKDTGITVNTIQPTIIDTPPNRAAMPGADFSRWILPQQIADLIVFLLSDSASAITGASIPVAGRV